MTHQQKPACHPPTSLAESWVNSNAETFSFRDLISKLFLRPKTFLFALLVPAIIAVLLASLVPSDWAASTKILIRYSQKDSGLLKGLVADAGSNLSGTTSAELIKSKPVLENTIRQVGIEPTDIYQKPMNVIKSSIAKTLKNWFGDDEVESESQTNVDGINAKLVGAFKASLDSASKKSSKGKSIEILQKNSQSGDYGKIDELISLQVRSFNRKKVAPMANGLANAFIDEFYRMYAEEAAKQAAYLDTLVAKQAAEVDMIKHATQADFASGRISVNTRESVKLDTPLIRSLTSRLNDVENELAKASQVYASNAPKVQRLRGQVRKVKFALKKQEYVEMSKQLLEQLKTRQYQAKNTENIYKNRLVPISIVEEATEPEASSAKKIKRLIVTGIIGLVLGTMLAVSLMIILNVLDPRLHFRREVESIAQVPVISSIPTVSVDVGKFKLKHFRMLRNNKEIKDSFFQIIAKVGRPNDSNGGKVISLAAPARGEGATFCSLALAFNLAKNKSTKVCLIDANFHKPMISKLFDTNEQNGLIEGLVSLQALSKYQNNISFNFAVIGAGSTNSKNQLGFYTDTAKAQIDALRTLFDYIIIDTGSALNNNEATVFGSIADEALLVAASSITRKGMLQAAINKLQSNNSRVSGIIFNQTKAIIPDFIYRMF